MQALTFGTPNRYSPPLNGYILDDKTPALGQQATTKTLRPMESVRAKLGAVKPVLMVRDVPASIRFFAALGFEALFTDSATDPKYAGVARDGVELHLQWHDASEWNYLNDRPTYRFAVDDVDRLFEEFRAVPNLDRTEVRATAWGTREFHVRDTDRNGLQFYRNLRR